MCVSCCVVCVDVVSWRSPKGVQVREKERERKKEAPSSSLEEPVRTGFYVPVEKNDVNIHKRSSVGGKGKN